ncbi:MAG: hypothetical protein QF619_03765 [Candidatus Binatia bacterium]|nr:hypothetical protein [Candidatus Binatia bacterium]
MNLCSREIDLKISGLAGNPMRDYAAIQNLAERNREEQPEPHRCLGELQKFHHYDF